MSHSSAPERARDDADEHEDEPADERGARKTPYAAPQPALVLKKQLAVIVNGVVVEGEEAGGLLQHVVAGRDEGCPRHSVELGQEADVSGVACAARRIRG
jgi:hypothetical protein